MTRRMIDTQMLLIGRIPEPELRAALVQECRHLVHQYESRRPQVRASEADHLLVELDKLLAVPRGTKAEPV